MSVTHVQSRSGHTTGSNTTTISITTTAGNLLGIWTQGASNATAAPTRTGETIAPAIADFSDASTNHARVDFAMNCGGNSNSVTCNATGSSNISNGAVVEVTGAATTSALGATHPTNTSAGGTTIQPGSITPTAASLLWTGCQTPGATGQSAATINSSFTVDEAGGPGTIWDTNGLVGGTAHLDNVAASGTNPIWTNNSGGTGWSAWMVEFLAAGGVVSLPPGLGPAEQMDVSTMASNQAAMR